MSPRADEDFWEGNREEEKIYIQVSKKWLMGSGIVTSTTYTNWPLKDAHETEIESTFK